MELFAGFAAFPEPAFDAEFARDGLEGCVFDADGRGVAEAALGGGALVRLFLGGTKVQSEESAIMRCGVVGESPAVGGDVVENQVVWGGDLLLSF